MEDAGIQWIVQTRLLRVLRVSLSTFFITHLYSFAWVPSIAASTTVGDSHLTNSLSSFAMDEMAFRISLFSLLSDPYTSSTLCP